MEEFNELWLQKSIAVMNEARELARIANYASKASTQVGGLRRRRRRRREKTQDGYSETAMQEKRITIWASVRDSGLRTAHPLRTKWDLPAPCPHSDRRTEQPVYNTIQLSTHTHTLCSGIEPNPSSIGG